MAKTRVFVSFDFDNDKNLKELIVGQAKNPDSPFEIADWSMKEAAPERNWEVEAEDRIKRSDRVLVLTGLRTYAAPGVLKEVAMARKHSKTIFQIKPQGTQPNPVPNAGNLYDWTWDNLKRLLA